MIKSIVIGLSVLCMATAASAVDTFEGTLKSVTSCSDGTVTKDKADATLLDYGYFAQIYGDGFNVFGYEQVTVPTKKGDRTLFMYYYSNSLDAEFKGDKVKVSVLADTGCLFEGSFKGKLVDEEE